ncbi:MAG: OmpA family protein [Bacteroidia bacterium]|nr:OmpA family protein [Bacteroidia bacterium]
MKKPLNAFLLFLCFAIPAVSQQTFFVYFKQNAVIPEKSEVPVIDSVCHLLNQHKDKKYSVFLQGFASVEGTEKANDLLSGERVSMVKEMLIRCATPQIERFVTEAEGGTEQFSEGNREDNYKMNRCVRILLQEITVKPPVSDPVVDESPYSFKKPESPSADSILKPLKELYEDIALPYQFFHILPGRDTFLVAESGTLFFIEKDAFEPCDSILLRVKEAYKLSDMIREGLTTLTLTNDMLQTYGMVYWDAYCKEKRVIPEKPLEVLIPTPKPVEMRIFNGIKPGNRLVFWNPESEAATTTLPDFVRNRMGRLHDGGMMGCDCPEKFSEKLRYSFTPVKRLPDTDKIENQKICGKWVLFKSKDKIEETCRSKRLLLAKRTQKEALENIEAAISQKSLGEALKRSKAEYYYLINRTEPGWTNCDIYANRKTGNIRLMATPDPNRVFQLVYDSRIILPLNAGVKSYQANGILDERGTLLEMKKTGNNQYILGKKLIKITNRLTVEEKQMAYQSCSTPAELIQALKVLMGE